MLQAKKIKEIILFILLSLPSLVFTQTDYSNFDFSKKNLQLYSDFNFFWEEFLSPDDDFLNPTETISFPFSWSRDNKYPLWGYGTFQKTILLPVKNKEYALRIPYTMDRYTLFVNGEILSRNGEVEKIKTKSNTRIASTLVKLPKVNEINIVVHVSNFDDLTGGFAHPFLIGEYDNVLNKYYGYLLQDSFLFGALIVIGLLYLSVYIGKKDEPATLYFGIFSLVMGLRTILYGEHILLLLNNRFNLEVEAALGHLTFYIAAPIFMKYISLLFPYKRSDLILKPMYIISLAFSIMAIFTYHSFYIRLLYIYQIFSTLGAFISFFIVVKRALHKKRKAIVTIVGFVFLLGAYINDVLVSQEMVSSPEMVSIGMLAFIISQGILLSLSIAKSFYKSERLAQELAYTNVSFKRFVPEEFLRYLNRDRVSEIELGDHTKLEMTVMFCDIRDFTTLSEKLTPEENFLFINSYLERIGPVIRRNGGFIDKYLGDGFMSLFPNGPDAAVNAALDLLRVLKIYNEHRSNSGYNKIDLGIGINTGDLMLGTIGENERMDSTVIADAVNICSRLESITKEFGINIAISENTYLNLQNIEEIDLRNIGKLYFKGKNKPVNVYEIFSLDPINLFEKKLTFRDDFEKAVDYHSMGLFEKSTPIFEDILNKFPEDSALAYYLKRGPSIW